MITIKHTQFTSNQDLAAILNVMTKVKMLDICKKLDLYVSPNLKKGKRPILAYCPLLVNANPPAESFPHKRLTKYRQNAIGRKD